LGAPSRIHEFLVLPGPCITLLLPPHHPGDGSGSSIIVLRTALRAAAEQLENRRVPRSVQEELLTPLEALATDSNLLAGSRSSRVVLRSRDLFEQFQLSAPAKASVTVAGSFAIRPFFSELSAPPQFYLLTLSKESVRLARGSALGLTAVDLPAGVPATIEQAMEFEPPDHDLENRSVVSGSTGGMRAVRFGTGSGRETRQAHLADFYRLVDRGIQKLLRDPEVPLILEGVDEDTVLYRSISTCRNLASGSIRGNGTLRQKDADLITQAFAIIHSERLERDAKSLADAKERTLPSRFLTVLEAILPAAFEGRVNQLYVQEEGESMGIFERPGYRSWGSEDLLNLAMVQTLRHRGKACMLPGNLLPDGAQAAAVLRY